MLNITDIRIRLVKDSVDGKLKGVASITLDGCFVVHDIKILNGNDGTLFISMPSRKNPNSGEYRDVAHPLDNNTRDDIRAKVLAKYEEELAKAQE